MNAKQLVCALLLTHSMLSGLSASTYTFNIGSWEPYIGKNLYMGGCLKKVLDRACEIGEIRYKIIWEDSWKRSWIIASKGESHGTFPWGQSEKRDRQMLRCQTPVLEDKRVGYYLKSDFPDGLKITSYEKIKKVPGIKPVAIRGYIDQEKYEKHGIEYHTVNSETLAWNMLQKGRVNFYIGTETVSELAIKKLDDPEFRQNLGIAGVMTTNPLYLYYTRINDDIIFDNKRLCAALDQMKKTKEIQKLISKESCSTQ